MIWRIIIIIILRDLVSNNTKQGSMDYIYKSFIAA